MAVAVMRGLLAVTQDLLAVVQDLVAVVRGLLGLARTGVSRFCKAELSRLCRTSPPEAVELLMT